MGRGLTISFDLDGTLTTSSFVDSVWLEGLPLLVASRQGIGFEEARNLCLEAYTLVGEDSLLWYRLPYWLDHFGVGHVKPGDLIGTYASRLELFDDVLPVLRRLKDKGFNLMLFSNASRDFLNVEVDRGELRGFFSSVISVSDDWGMVKSDTEAFMRLRNMVDGDLVHVGDHRRFDFEIPRAAGIRSYHICRSSGAGEGDCFEDLHQFANVIIQESD